MGTKRKASSKQILQHQEFESELEYALADFEVRPLALNKKEKMLRMRKKNLRKEALIRGQKAKCDYVLSFYSTGRKKRLALDIELREVVSGEVAWQEKMHPLGKDEGIWTETLREAVAPFLEASPPEPVAPESTQESAESAAQPLAAVDSSSKKKTNQPMRSTENNVGSVASAMPQNSAIVKADSNKAPHFTSNSFSWMWLGSGAGLGLLATGLLGSGAFMGSQAWSESEQFVDGGNRTLRDSSQNKAVIADALWLTGGAMAIGSLGLVSVGFLLSNDSTE